MLSRAVVLFIKVKMRDPTSHLILRNQRDESLKVRVHLDLLSSKEQWQQLYEDLDKVRRSLKRGGWSAINQAVQRLHKRGARIVRQLTAKRSDCPRIEKFCQEACDGWNLDGLPRPYVEVAASRRAILPIQFFPLLGMQRPAEIKNGRTLLEAVRSFLGYSTIIKRAYPQEPFSGRNLEASPKLPIKFFHALNLPGAKKEFQFLKRDGRIDVDGPWPTPLVVFANFTKDLAYHLLKPTEQFDGLDQHPPSQIYHLSCHCDRSKMQSDCHSLRFDTAWSVTIGDLRDELDLFARRLGVEAGTIFSLVFLNACESAVIDPSQIDSFPDLFLWNNHCGFIGTEVSVSDKWASVFSRKFYSFFLDGHSLGEAIHMAKRKVLYRKNLTGLFYTLYADPDIQINFSNNSRSSYVK